MAHFQYTEVSVSKTFRRGFTLIELMIVVAIIGILAAVAVPKFASLTIKSREATVKGNMGAVRSAINIYYGDTDGIYPLNLYVGLTTNAKYLPSLANLQTLGNFVIPAQTSNPGHAAVGIYSNINDTGVLQSDGTSINDSTALYFVNVVGGRNGEVFVNCTHVDTKSQVWTSF